MAADSTPQDGEDTRAAEQARESLRISEHVGKIVASIRHVATNLKAYAPGHPAVKSAASQMVQHISKALTTTDALDVTITSTGMEYHTVPLYDVAELVTELVGICQRKKIGRIVFLPGVEDEEALSFVNVLWEADKADVEVEGIAAKLKKLNVSHFVLERGDFEEDELEKLDKQRKEERERKGPRISDPKMLYRALVEGVKETMTQVGVGGNLGTQILRSLAKDIGLFLHDNRSILLPLAAIRRYDQYEYTHPVNVCLLSVSVLAQVVEDSRELPGFAQAALLFNVGEAFLPEQAADKSGEMTEEYKRARHDHPLRGAGVLDDTEGFSKLAMVAAFEHHLGSDFSGYPKQKHRWRQNFFSSVLTVADAYDSLTTKHGRAPTLCPDAAIARMTKHVGAKFDRTAFDAFVAALGPFPLGSLVELNTSQIAVVTGRQTENRELQVKVITDSEKHILDEPEVSPAALPDNPKAPRFVQRSIDANNVALKVIDYL